MTLAPSRRLSKRGIDTRGEAQMVWLISDKAHIIQWSTFRSALVLE
jgi:hypothetical protein